MGNAAQQPLAVRVTYWKPYVETLPRSKPGKRSPTNTRLRGSTPSAISSHAFCFALRLAGIACQHSRKGA